MPNESNSATPPYVSYGVFKSTIDQLAETTVPTGPLDRRVLDWLSGADHGALMSGLRFLNLVDDDRKATESYRNLVHASKDGAKYKAALKELIEGKYKGMLGNVNIQHGTISELEKAFKDAGVSQGQMLTKTVRFFVKALTDAGVPVSPHITKPKPKAPRTASAKTNAKPRAGKEHVPAQHFQVPEGGTIMPQGFERMPIPGVTNAFIQYPTALTESHCAMFAATIEVLKAYAKGRAGGKETKP